MGNQQVFKQDCDIRFVCGRGGGEDISENSMKDGCEEEID